MLRRSSGSPARRRKRAGGSIDVVGRYEHAVLAVAQQVACCADAVGEDERQAAGGRFVHDHAPGLVAREEREDVCGRVRLDDRLPGQRRERRAHAELAGEPFQARALGTFADDEDGEVGARRGVHERVDALLRREAGDGEHGHVVMGQAEALAKLRAATLEPVGPARRSARRRRCSRRPGSVRAPRRAPASNRAASEPVTSTLAAPLTMERDDRLLHAPPPAGLRARRRGSRRGGGTARCLARHHPIAACDANVLQPETTTQSGSRLAERAPDPERDRIVVAEDVTEARHRHAVQEHRMVLRLDGPRPAGDCSRGIDHGQVDVRVSGDAVEERRAVRRRLGRDERDARHRTPSFQPALRTFSRQRSGAPGLRRSRPPRRTWLASCSV